MELVIHLNLKSNGEKAPPYLKILNGWIIGILEEWIKWG
jgi:hypothetical protein